MIVVSTVGKTILLRWLQRAASAAAEQPHNDALFLKTNKGWCACCRADSEFVETGVWLRDQYLCTHCGSIPRMRAVNLTLDRYFPSWEQSVVHESSPSNDFIQRYCPRYSSSYYFEGVTLGTEH